MPIRNAVSEPTASRRYACRSHQPTVSPSSPPTNSPPPRGQPRNSHRSGVVSALHCFGSHRMDLQGSADTKPAVSPGLIRATSAIAEGRHADVRRASRRGTTRLTSWPPGDVMIGPAYVAAAPDRRRRTLPRALHRRPRHASAWESPRLHLTARQWRVLRSGHSSSGQRPRLSGPVVSLRRKNCRHCGFGGIKSREKALRHASRFSGIGRERGFQDGRKFIQHESAGLQRGFHDPREGSGE